jgi:hypothetical protein
MLLYKPNEKIYGNTLEMHYWFGDNSHSINASVINRCDYEILGILNEISNILSVNIEIETEPSKEGGFRKWLKITTKGENKNATITTAIIVALVTTLLTTPLAKISENIINNLFEDTELKELEKEKIKLEILKLKQETSKHLINNSLIKKKKSNFYQHLEKYPKVKKISYNITNERRTEKTKDMFIEKNDFKKYILTSDDLEPVDIEDAIIEIISPVLKKGKYKWTGYYKGESISFNMKSVEFKTLVQSGGIEFKNGSSINCFLKIRKKINNEGMENIAGYDVIRVNKYFESDKPIETSEGKAYRKKKEADERQVDLFASYDDDKK